MGKAIFVISLVFLFISCASVSSYQPLVSSMVSASSYKQALKTLADDYNIYGKNNQLLYFLDKGYIEHLDTSYDKSILTLDKAKLKFDELYTESVSKIAATWAINDYSAPYRGEDFEQVLINIFQALNYMMLGNHEDALVEARDVDSKLQAINLQYNADQKNVYKEDAFARLLMGILYEFGHSDEDINNAFISYVKAAAIYEHDYAENYGVSIPRVLKENILSTARVMGLPEFSKFRAKFKEAEFISINDKAKKSEVYLIQYNGLAPIKVEQKLAVPMLDGYIVKVAFPAYKPRVYGVASSRLLARDANGVVFQAATEIAEDIGAIAVKNLDKRKLRFMAKTAVRAGARYALEKKQEENIAKKFGDLSASWFRFVSNIYNIVAEQADLRCWQTLPDQIRITRLLLPPATYEFTAENFSSSGSHLGQFNLGKFDLEASQTKIFILHTVR